MNFAAKQHAGSVYDDEKLAEPPLSSIPLSFLLYITDVNIIHKGNKRMEMSHFIA